MIERLIQQYFVKARAVAQSIGIDAYFIDERSDRVVRVETNGSYSFLGTLDDGQTNPMPATLVGTESTSLPTITTRPGEKYMKRERKSFAVEIKRARLLAWKERRLQPDSQSSIQLPWNATGARQAAAGYRSTNSRMSSLGKGEDH